MKNFVSYANDLLSKDLHNWLLASLGVLYGGIALALAIAQIRTGSAPDVAIMKDVGGTLVWWGGIVATAHSSKSIATTMKGNGGGGDPAAAPPGSAAGASGAP